MDTGGGEWAAARQMQLARSFVGGEIDGVHFAHEFLSARNEEFSEGETQDFALARWLDEALYVIDDYNEFDEPLEPGEIDAEQLRALLKRHLAAWDAGGYDQDPD
jgi:hypothetical protein